MEITLTFLGGKGELMLSVCLNYYSIITIEK